MDSNTVKSALVLSVLISPIPSMAMDGGNNIEPKRGESIISKEDLEGHRLTEELSKEEHIVKDVVPQIQRERINQDYFSFTCPSVDELIDPDRKARPLTVNHDGIEFNTITFDFKNIKFKNVNIGKFGVQCNYDDDDDGVLNTSYISDINADCQVHYKSEKFHQETYERETVEGQLPFYTYASDSPQDINIICKKR